MPSVLPEPRQWWVPAEPAFVPLMRRQVLAAVREWKVCDDADAFDDIAVCASELVTNGVDHAWTSTIGVSVAWTGTAVRIEVIDKDPLIPSRGDADLSDVHGRGLALLEALGTWGSERRSCGKVVWAEIPVPVASAASVPPARSKTGTN
ncbi:ATP-binding protein [Yinghuangia sp. YIM S10712]|uniref:ATP-binding protein n=1 Tax=Yinghuangia sp. YIM S10712 TaxID=3436930 RepID=UPI003F535744